MVVGMVGVGGGARGDGDSYDDGEGCLGWWLLVLVLVMVMAMVMVGDDGDGDDGDGYKVMVVVEDSVMMTMVIV